MFHNVQLVNVCYLIASSQVLIKKGELNYLVSIDFGNCFQFKSK